MSKETKKSQSQFMDTFKRLCRNKTAVIGLIIVIALALIALLSPVFYDYDSQIIKTNYSAALQGPSAEHWFGTDEMGVIFSTVSCMVLQHLFPSVSLLLS